ncbi:hypothetical protein RhiirA4_476009 [Rhizophagus irregularis]|uniref:Uncharacterized protein n=1 Tax=Rhizophagus irregularis TaxID=588596 RepID=A0A2I1HB16_9GLOM|nr:hypothetical protein RhiirA4_476009 [Rhizophagus irregularis]
MTPKYMGNKEVPIPTLRTPNEDEVVDAISKWRLTDKPPHDQFDDRIEKGKQPEIPKNDNIAPEEVVEVIKNYRIEKSNYTRLNASPSVKEVRTKLVEIGEIFEANYQKEEWTLIQGTMIKDMKEEAQITDHEEFKVWMRKEENYLVLAKKIITTTENHGLFQHFTALNEDFLKRLEDENRYQDNKEIGDKRPILESPEAPEQVPWMVAAEESEEEEDTIEDEKNVEEEEEKKSNKLDPSKQQKSKKKRKGKKKH